MQINWPVTDDATAGQSDGGFLATAQRRSKHADRGAHFAHDVVRRNRVDLFCRDADGPAGAFHLRAEISYNLQHVMRVAQIGHAVNDTRLSSKQRSSQDRQRRILRAADLNGTGKRMTAVDEDFIHTWQKGT